MIGKYTPFHTADTNIYLANNLGGFSVRHCPDAEELAALIVRAVNAHDALVKALARMVDEFACTDDDCPRGCKKARAALALAGETP